MRTPNNDGPPTAVTLSGIATQGAAAGDDPAASRPARPATRAEREAAERRCILTGEHGPRDALLRLALSPDGALLPDIAAKAPGRGAWIAVDRAALESAIAKGKFKGALARAFKGARVDIPAELPAMIEDAFARAFLAQLGLAAKAGALITGADRIDSAARAGTVRWLAHAADAAEDGRRKRDQSWRVGMEAEGTGMAGMILPFDRARLGIALGRENAVHLALAEPAWADRIGGVVKRWHRFAGWSRGAPQDEAGTPMPAGTPRTPYVA